MTLLIKNVVLDGEVTDVAVAGNRFVTTVTNPDEVIECNGRMAIVPPFYNSHTHAAMTLLRGYADDLELGEWLTQHIWPAEAEMSVQDVYVGTRLAILEMIKSGTVFFNDMYWEQAATARAATEMGVRAAIGLLHLAGPDGNQNPRSERSNAELLELEPDLPDRIMITQAPHSVYAVPEQMLRSVAQTDRMIHIHVSETAKENADCLAATGRTPVAYLDDLGLIGPRSVLAHCVHLDNRDRAIIAEREATIAHCATSNMKLCNGQFDYVSAGGLRITLGTDGASSNNCLSMLSEMKVASLSAKARAGLPTVAPDHEVWDMATAQGAAAFGIEAGRIAPGMLADALLISLDHHQLIADHSLVSNLVYAADSHVVDTVICNGRILMRERHVEGEAEILAEAKEAAARVRARKASATS